MPLQRSHLKLWRELLLVILLLVGLILLLVDYIGSLSRKDFSTTVITQTAERATSDFVGRFQPINSTLEIIQKWGLSELPTTNKVETLDTPLLNARLIPILESLPTASPFHLATSSGREYLLIKKGEEWLTRSTNVAQWGAKQKWQRWATPGEPVEEWWQEQAYDPRNEPWFKTPETLQTNRWSQPYSSSVDQKLTITGATHWQRQDSKLTYVAAFDVPLVVIYQAAAKLKTTPNGISFIISGNDRVLIPAAGPLPAETTVNGVGPLELRQIENPIIAKAVELLDHQATTPTVPFHFQYEGKDWWAGFNPIRTTNKSIFWIGTLIPESDFLGNITQRRGITYALIALICLAGGLLSFFLIRRHSLNQKQSIHTASDLQQRLAKIISAGEGYQQEFKSTMRQNLRENKPDKGIELAWLKTVVGFLNSAGGVLLLGITDDGTTLGLSADNFANEDKCRLHFKNLIKQHIGLEYSRYIHLELVEHEKLQIAVVQCEAAGTPVFLQVKNEEEYYIRSGPSSTKLTGSKLLQYLAHKPTDETT